MEIGHYYLLDTFADAPFKGSPTPICVLSKTLDKKVRHKLAQELNAPVTAFIAPPNQDNAFPIQYFTIEGEIPACGHATLGAAFVLFAQDAGFQKVTFSTTENILLEAQKDKELIYVKYPRFPVTTLALPPLLLEALGITIPSIYFYSPALQSLFIELENPNQVKSIQPNFELLKQSSDEIKEVVIMSKSSDNEFDFVLRSFCPWIGIDEDPVTGSIHSVLGPYWQTQTKKDNFAVFQASARGGEVFIKVFDDYVALGGHCKVLVAGKLFL